MLSHFEPLYWPLLYTEMNITSMSIDLYHSFSNCILITMQYKLLIADILKSDKPFMNN